MRVAREAHRVFKRRGEPVQLNFQNRDGSDIPPYQARQLGADDREVRIEPMKCLVEVFWSDDDQGYIAVVPDLPGCSAFGNHARGRGPRDRRRHRSLDRRLPRHRRPGPRTHDQGPPSGLIAVPSIPLNGKGS